MKVTIVSFNRGQCDSLKSSASTETTGVETPELSMVLEKASGEKILILNQRKLPTLNNLLIAKMIPKEKISP